MIETTIEHINYVRVMSKFYTAMGFLRGIFSIMVICYQVQRYYRNYKMSYLQVVVIWLIQFLTILQTAYSIWWNYRVLLGCEFWSRNISAFIDINMFLVGILVTHYMHITVNMIYKFSIKGRLPRETQRKRLKCILIGIITFAVVLLTAYVSLTYYTQMVLEDFNGLRYVNFVFVGLRAAGLLFNAF